MAIIIVGVAEAENRVPRVYLADNDTYTRYVRPVLICLDGVASWITRLICNQGRSLLGLGPIPVPSREPVTAPRLTRAAMGLMRGQAEEVEDLIRDPAAQDTPTFGGPSNPGWFVIVKLGIITKMLDYIIAGVWGLLFPLGIIYMSYKIARTINPVTRTETSPGPTVDQSRDPLDLVIQRQGDWQVVNPDIGPVAPILPWEVTPTVGPGYPIPPVDLNWTTRDRLVPYGPRQLPSEALRVRGEYRSVTPSIYVRR